MKIKYRMFSGCKREKKQFYEMVKFFIISINLHLFQFYPFIFILLISPLYQIIIYSKSSRTKHEISLEPHLISNGNVKLNQNTKPKEPSLL